RPPPTATWNNMNVSISQAMATGLPVITTRHSGLPEQVTDNVNGFLVTEGDYHALAEKIIEMIQHSERWAEMGRKGRARVEANYNSDRLLDRQVALYEEILQR